MGYGSVANIEFTPVRPRIVDASNLERNRCPKMQLVERTVSPERAPRPLAQLCMLFLEIRAFATLC